MKARDIIQFLNLEEHPEGGYFRETYRAKELIPNSVLGNSFQGDRNVCTGIYFLLTSKKFSAFHKVNQDEMWHFYLGSTLKIHMISESGNYSSILMGTRLLNNEIPQYTIAGGMWFAVEVLEENSFSLVGCTVAPGFDFRDFNLPSSKELLNLFPQHEKIINRLTH